MKTTINTSIHRDLIEQCKQGNRTSQYQLYNQYADAMYSVSLNMLKNQQDAEDVLQVSFSKAFNHIETFNYSSTFGAWLKRIVINNSINSLKAKKISYVIEEEVHHLPAVEPSEKEKFPYTVNAVKDAIQQLPDGYRIVLTLYLLEGYDHVEISDLLGVAVSTSKTQYSRAKKKLRQILKNG